jgi:purine nucleosidase
MTETIILDCDPGIDDALAIVYAVGSDDLDLAGITTVAGNVSLEKTTANALRLRDYLGAGEVPVVAGSAEPLLRPPLTAEHVHGRDGLGGAPLPAPSSAPRAGHATDFIIETVLARPGQITLVATGPLTNVALAIRREPRVVTQVRDFVIMGGSTARGNVTPAAEFNMAADPEAAAIVFAAGWTVTMVGLDVTLQAIAHAGIRARLSGLGRLAEELLLPCLRGYADGQEPAVIGGVADQATPGAAAAAGGPAVHDVCAVAHVARRELLGCVPARVEVETAGRWTSGMTVTDLRAPANACNALVATTIDVPAFWDSAATAWGRVAASMAVIQRGGDPADVL